MGVIEKYGLNPKEWIHYGQWVQPPFSASFWIHRYDKDIIKKMGINSLNGRFIMVNGYNILFKDDLVILNKHLRRVCNNKDKNFFERFNRISLKILDDHLKLCSVLEDCKEADIELFDRFITSAKRVMVPWYISVILVDFLGEILLEKAEKYNIGSSTIVNSIPEKETLMINQYNEALGIRSLLEKKGLLGAREEKIKQDKELWKKIEDYVKEYGWVGTHHFWGEPLSINKFLKEVVLLKKSSERIEDIDLPDEFRFLIPVAGDLAFIRQYSAEVFDLVAYKARPLLDVIAKKLDLSYEELLLLTPIETSTHLKNGTKPLKENIIKRDKGFGFFLKNGKEIIVDDSKEIEKLIKAFVPKSDISVREFEGIVANKGYAKGIAKIFLVPENLSKMKHGNILITPMTSPDFIPLMQKASAIVTDTGGLLSHAAIVSREIGKPCIIGTKVATKVLKDGDEIEVDAVKGIVRKLK